jgi:hypothetical protein
MILLHNSVSHNAAVVRYVSTSVTGKPNLTRALKVGRIGCSSYMYTSTFFTVVAADLHDYG